MKLSTTLFLNDSKSLKVYSTNFTSQIQFTSQQEAYPASEKQLYNVWLWRTFLKPKKIT